MAGVYRIRLREPGGEVQILDVSFSQLSEHYLPCLEGDQEARKAQRRAERGFWTGALSLDGPRGNVKLLTGPR